MPPKQRKRKSQKVQKRHSAGQRAAILAEAKAGRMTGAEVAAKYGIAAITYYVWRQQAGERGWYGVGKRGGWAQTRESSQTIQSKQMKGLFDRILREVVDEELRQG